MDLRMKAMMLLILLAALIMPISANSDMDGCPGGDCGDQTSSGSMSSETGGTIIISTSGGYPGQQPGVHYPGQTGSFTSGYTSPKSGSTITPFLGVLLTELQTYSGRLAVVGNKLEGLKQTEKVGGDKWRTLNELQMEVNDIRKDLQQSIGTVSGGNPVTWDADPNYPN